MRINKYLSESGICSRREADKFIASGKVFINEVRAVLGSQVNPGDKVRIGNREAKILMDKVYIAYHKPIGVVSTSDPKIRNNIVSKIRANERIYPIGRLDKNTSGLILLTNDGDIVNKILRAENKLEKEYHVILNQDHDYEFIKNMRKGVEIDISENPEKRMMYKTLPAKVEETGKDSFSIIITEGKNRQIRKMCAALGYKILELKRVRIGNLLLGTLAVGAKQVLSEKDIMTLIKKK